MSKNHKVIIKTKIVWIYAPDKAEIWLENMENRGYHLVRMAAWATVFTLSAVSPAK